jgi:hypothetical protein
MSTKDILTKQSPDLSEMQIDVDYVLIFDARTKTKEDYADVQLAYRKVTDALNSAGLQHTSRPGAAASNEILIFIKAKPDRLQSEVYAQGLNDW